MTSFSVAPGNTQTSEYFYRHVRHLTAQSSLAVALGPGAQKISIFSVFLGLFVYCSGSHPPLDVLILPVFLFLYSIGFGGIYCVSYLVHLVEFYCLCKLVSFENLSVMWFWPWACLLSFAFWTVVKDSLLGYTWPFEFTDYWFVVWTMDLRIWIWYLFSKKMTLLWASHLGSTHPVILENQGHVPIPVTEELQSLTQQRAPVQSW